MLAVVAQSLIWVGINLALKDYDEAIRLKPDLAEV